MFAQHPILAKEMANKTPDMKHLPEKKKSKVKRYA